MSCDSPDFDFLLLTDRVSGSGLLVRMVYDDATRHQR